jgi:hypothetical protein
MELLIAVATGVLCGIALGAVKEVISAAVIALCILGAGVITALVLGVDVSSGGVWAFIGSALGAAFVTGYMKASARKSRDDK